MRRWPCNRVYYGNYLALDQFYSESAAYRQAELELLRNSGEKCVIFSDVVQKVNKVSRLYYNYYNNYNNREDYKIYNGEQ
jgi:hypothetical protein